jgi:hypothetical protein
VVKKKQFKKVQLAKMNFDYITKLLDILQKKDRIEKQNK